MIRDLVLNKAFLEIDSLELEYINGGVNWYQVLTVVDTVLFGQLVFQYNLKLENL